MQKIAISAIAALLLTSCTTYHIYVVSGKRQEPTGTVQVRSTVQVSRTAKYNRFTEIFRKADSAFNATHNY